MTEAAIKTPPPKTEPPFVRMRGMTRADLMDKGAYLCLRLRERYPNKQERELYGWLQSCCGNNEYFFVRSDHAYLLAHRSHDFLDHRPTTREIFALAELRTEKPAKGSDAEKFQDEQNALAVREAAALYDSLLRWCSAIGAGELVIDKFSDVPLGEKGKDEPGTLRAIFGQANIKLYRGEEIFASLDPNAKIRKLGA